MNSYACACKDDFFGSHPVAREHSLGAVLIETEDALADQNRAARAFHIRLMACAMSEKGFLHVQSHNTGKL